ncbi:MAG TPA: chemotaxis protein CheX [Deltaproteobacteria bacterium]|nr:chemotaxis protein CheX [Deltaproteobacteria bacterium]HQI82415.1 chemotaxis protein CheX [Deltaproteobacteria bacterium]
MPDTPSQYLTEALSHVLLSMVSLSPRITDAADMPEVKGDALNVRIEYSGEHAGELGLIIEKPLAVLMAARILGMEQTKDVYDDMIEDALRELLNVVCGHFVTLMYGYMPVLKISLPKVFTIGSAVCNVLRTNPNVCTFMVEDSPLLGQVKVK